MLKLSELLRRARAVGVAQEALDEAADSADQKDVLISLVLDSETRPEEELISFVVEQGTGLQDELQGLTLRELRKRAKEAGVGATALESAMDEDEPEAAVIELLMNAAPSAAAGTAEGAKKLSTMPHFGLAPSSSAAGAPPSIRALFGKKHAMLSVKAPAISDESSHSSSHLNFSRLMRCCGWAVPVGVAGDCAAYPEAAHRSGSADLCVYPDSCPESTRFFSESPPPPPPPQGWTSTAEWVQIFMIRWPMA